MPVSPQWLNSIPYFDQSPRSSGPHLYSDLKKWQRKMIARSPSHYPPLYISVSHRLSFFCVLTNLLPTSSSCSAVFQHSPCVRPPLPIQKTTVSHVFFSFFSFFLFFLQFHVHCAPFRYLRSKCSPPMCPICWDPCGSLFLHPLTAASLLQHEVEMTQIGSPNSPHSHLLMITGMSILLTFLFFFY